MTIIEEYLKNPGKDMSLVNLLSSILDLPDNEINQFTQDVRAFMDKLDPDGLVHLYYGIKSMLKFIEEQNLYEFHMRLGFDLYLKKGYEEGDKLLKIITK